MESPFVPTSNMEMQAAFDMFNKESETSLLDLLRDFEGPTNAHTDTMEMEVEVPTTTGLASTSVPTDGDTVLVCLSVPKAVFEKRVEFNGGKPFPSHVVYVDQGRKKQLQEDMALSLIDNFNMGGSVDFAFPGCSTSAASDNLFLGWRISKRMLTMGFDFETIDRTICVLGNRHCLGCIKKIKGGKNGDLVAGTMHCNKCLEHAKGSLDDHIDEFLAMSFNKWARNIKAVV